MLLIRHGQSTWNALGRWQGQADIPLSSDGRQQSRMAAERLGTPDAIVSSPQQRALETASILSAAVGVGPVLIHEDLRERSAGTWSGLTHDEIHSQYPGWLDDGRRPEGYESDESVLERVVPVLFDIAHDHPGATVVVVSHGGIIRALEHAVDLEDGRVPNLSGRMIVMNSPTQLVIADQVNLLDARDRTGGDPERV